MTKTMIDRMDELFADADVTYFCETCDDDDQILFDEGEAYCARCWQPDTI